MPQLVIRVCTFCLLALLWNHMTAITSRASELRRSAIVRAIARAQPAVVNIHGHKLVSNDGGYRAGRQASQREVNGMGTGVVIDARGYIVTNYHVVEGVRRINVSLSNGDTYLARVVSHDPATDLAVIKVPTKQPMPMIPIGRSHDLMIGEEVIAIGNAYGYEHTHTRGIISALHRTVKVTDHQYYRDLIQTDASINPGNSGGPLLNVDGQMIGINVAVRVGAQGIGFAIPSDKAMQIAARLLSAERLGSVWHGIVPNDAPLSQPGVVTQEVQSGSPAAKAGMRPGDRIVRINSTEILRTLDLERAMIGLKPGNQVDVKVVRNQRSQEFKLRLGSSAQVQQASIEKNVDDRVWSEFGLQLEPLAHGEVRLAGGQFSGGLRVRKVREGSPAENEGVKHGDILVGIHDWVTTSRRDLEFIMRSEVVVQQPSVKFYIVRDGNTLFGHFPVTWR